MRNLLEIAKSGTIAPTDMYASGELRPEASRKFFNTVISQNAFLSKITTHKTSKIKSEVDIWGLGDGNLVRVAGGTRPSELQRQKLIPTVVSFENLSVQLHTKILRATLEDNKDNPSFEKDTFDTFNRGFGNDLLNLGLNGEADTGDSFVNLNKGWLKIAKDSDEVAKVEFQENTKIIDRLTNLVKGSKNLQDDSVILISKHDFTALQIELGHKNGGLSILMNGGATNILGVPLEVVPYMPNDTYFLTPLKNLFMSVTQTVIRDRWWDNDEAALKYRFEINNDYEIVVKKYTTLAHKAAVSDG
ncbi:P2 family phage major capsid protein [Campylobacter lanienae]|uniref:P2 family phage major capsid protein n=1 Tax=Campylobacter lanienae TaxID=75658 RepID=UPI000BB40CCF|nr:P2 family phage major capsid protein [Campylobacter lanienae]